MNNAKKLGIMISAGPNSESCRHGLELAEAALHRGLQVYLYCIDDAVAGLAEPRLAALKQNGAHLFACAYSAQERGIQDPGPATFSGLTILCDLVSSTDRFTSFN